MLSCSGRSPRSTLVQIMKPEWLKKSGTNQVSLLSLHNDGVREDYRTEVSCKGSVDSMLIWRSRPRMAERSPGPVE